MPLMDCELQPDAAVDKFYWWQFFIIVFTLLSSELLRRAVFEPVH